MVKKEMHKWRAKGRKNMTYTVNRGCTTKSVIEILWCQYQLVGAHNFV